MVFVNTMVNEDIAGLVGGLWILEWKLSKNDSDEVKCVVPTSQTDYGDDVNGI